MLNEYILILKNVSDGIITRWEYETTLELKEAIKKARNCPVCGIWATTKTDILSVDPHIEFNEMHWVNALRLRNLS
jgi:hypothetical protein